MASMLQILPMNGCVPSAKVLAITQWCLLRTIVTGMQTWISGFEKDGFKVSFEAHGDLLRAVIKEGEGVWIIGFEYVFNDTVEYPLPPPFTGPLPPQARTNGIIMDSDHFSPPMPAGSRINDYLRILWVDVFPDPGATLWNIEDAPIYKVDLPNYMTYIVSASHSEWYPGQSIFTLMTVQGPYPSSTHFF